jgi:hypothetical protein
MTTDAEYQEWCTWVSGELTTKGWTKTSDTGQINTSTVTVPASTYAEQGYEIRTSPTSSHTTMYIKVWYRSGANAAIPTISIQVGTGSDGAGTLTGTVGSVKPLLTGGFNTGGTSPYTANMGIHGDADSLWIHYIDGINPVYSSLVGLERTTNGSGASTDDGVLTMTHYYNQVTRWQTLLWVGGAATEETVTSTLRLTRLAMGGNTNVVLPIFVNDGGGAMRQFRDIVFAYASSGMRFDATVKGASRTYRSGYFGNNANTFGYTPPDAMGLCVREAA